MRKSLQFLSGFWLKVLGFLFMTIDHVGFFMMNKFFDVNPDLYNVGYAFRCAGRIAFPIFAFLVAEGIRHSKNGWKYFYRLLGMHLALQLVTVIFVFCIPNTPGPNEIAENAFADLALLALTLLLLRLKGGKKALAAIPIAFAIFVYVLQVLEKAQGITIWFFPRMFRPGYSLFGLLVGIAFYYSEPLTRLFAKRYGQSMGMNPEALELDPAFRKMVNVLSIMFLFAITLIFWGVSYIGYEYESRPLDNYYMSIESYCLIAMPLIYVYNGKRGYDNKVIRIVSYLYYPVHIAVLFLIFSL